MTSVEIWGQKPSGIYIQAQKIIYVPSTIFLLTSPSETLKETKHQVQSYVTKRQWVLNWDLKTHEYLKKKTSFDIFDILKYHDHIGNSNINIEIFLTLFFLQFPANEWVKNQISMNINVSALQKNPWKIKPNKFDLPISGHCFYFIHPEKTRKPLIFWCLRGL